MPRELLAETDTDWTAVVELTLIVTEAVNWLPTKNGVMPWSDTTR